MRVLVCGGRDYDDYLKVLTVLMALAPDTVVVHGAARGADSLADKAAARLGYEREPYPADWDTHGKKAGPIRNGQMLATGVHLVIAFPGGKGTDDMKKKARTAGVPVLEVT